MNYFWRQDEKKHECSLIIFRPVSSYNPFDFKREILITWKLFFFSISIRHDITFSQKL